MAPCWPPGSRKPGSLHSSAPASSAWSPPFCTAQWCRRSWTPSLAAGTPPAHHHRCCSTFTHTRQAEVRRVNTRLYKYHKLKKSKASVCVGVLLEVIGLGSVAALASVWVQCTGVKHSTIVSHTQFYTKNPTKPPSSWVWPFRTVQQNPSTWLKFYSHGLHRQEQLSASSFDHSAKSANLTSFLSHIIDHWQRMQNEFQCKLTRNLYHIILFFYETYSM